MSSGDPTLLNNMDQTVVLQSDQFQYAPNGRMVIQIPSSIKKTVWSESYMSLDFLIDDNESGFVGVLKDNGEAGISLDPTASTGAMFQLNPFTGVHSIFKDVYLRDGAGRELDSSRNYDELAMSKLPYGSGDDELAFKSHQEGITYLSRPNENPPANRVENQSKSSYASELYYQPYILNSQLVYSGANLPAQQVPVRTQRFTFPLSALGIMNSNGVFDNMACNGTKLELLLQSKEKALGKIYDSKTIVGSYNDATFTLTLASIDYVQHPSYLDLFRRGLCVGTQIIVQDSAGDYFTAQITQLNHTVVMGNDNVNLVLNIVSGSPVSGTMTIVDVAPLRIPNYRITNVQLFVRETIADESTPADTQLFTFVSHYNIPQSMVAGSFNPNISWSIIPVTRCLGLHCVPTDENARIWVSKTYNGSTEGNSATNTYSYNSSIANFGGYNQEKYMANLESTAFSQKVTAYQWQVGTELHPSQPDNTIMKEVWQYGNYELKNWFNALNSAPFSFKLNSFSNDGVEDNVNAIPSLAYTTDADKCRILYHRQFNLALAPSPVQVLSLVDKPVQLRIENSSAFTNNHTMNLWVSHYRTALLSPNGSQISM